MTAKDRAIFALWRLAALLGHPRLHWKYVRRMKRIPDVARPVLFSERMLWRKLFDRNPDFVTFSDKLACKRWIAERLPDLPIPRVLWDGERPEDIPQELIRTGVAIKANHGSGFNLLIHGAPPPREQVVETARRWLATEWGRRRGEWPYAQVPRRVFVEELIAPGPDDPPDARLLDIKVHAGDGRIGMTTSLGVAADGRRGGVLYGPAGQRITDVNLPLPELPEAEACPELLRRAQDAARILSRGVDHARFDFLALGERLYAGEITVFHMAGYRDFGPVTRPLMEAAWDLRASHFLREGAARQGWLARAYGAALTRAEGG